MRFGITTMLPGACKPETLSQLMQVRPSRYDQTPRERLTELTILQSEEDQIVLALVFATSPNAHPRLQSLILRQLANPANPNQRIL